MDVKKFLPIIGIIILVYIISTLDLSTIVDIFLEIDIKYSLLSLFAIIPIVLSSNIQWQILLKKQKINVSFLNSFKNIFIGYFYGFITPGGFGAYIRAWYLKYDSKAPLPKCVSNIITFNTIDYITLLLLGAVGALLLSGQFPNLFLPIIIVLIIVLSLFVFFLKKEKSKIVFTKLVQSKIFAALKDRIEDPIESFYENLPSFKDVILPFFISIIGWIIRFSELYIISLLFDIHVPYFYFIFIIAVADVIATIPISIFGLGVREGSLITLFSIYSIIPEKILSLSLFWFALVWFFPSIIGAIITVFESKKIGPIPSKK
jgi:hypothetical protein